MSSYSLPATRYSILFGYLLLVCAWFLAACSSKRPEDIKTPDAAPVLAGLQFTEATVLGEVADVRLALREAVTASKGLPSEPAVRAAAAQVETSLATVEAALAAHPAADVAKLIEEFKRAIEQLRTIIKQRDAEIASLKDAALIFWQRLLIGAGIVATLGGVASMVFAGSVPIFGPRLALMLGVFAGVCFALATLMKWAQANPGWASGGAVLFLGIAGGLAWANRVDHRRNAVA